MRFYNRESTANWRKYAVIKLSFRGYREWRKQNGDIFLRIAFAENNRKFSSSKLYNFQHINTENKLEINRKLWLEWNVRKRLVVLRKKQHRKPEMMYLRKNNQCFKQLWRKQSKTQCCTCWLLAWWKNNLCYPNQYSRNCEQSSKE